jgi:hypothetical protein
MLTPLRSPCASGALFVREAGGDHFCTASVVASPGRDLLITAAHWSLGSVGRMPASSRQAGVRLKMTPGGKDFLS